MGALRRLALAFAIVLATFGSAAAQPAPETAAPAGGRQILVFLRSPPQHFRPNSTYGGAYGDGEARSARLRVASRLAREYGVALVSEWPMPLLGVDCFVMTVPTDQSPEDVAARLAQDPSVSWSEPIHLYEGQAEAISHNDPLYRVQPAAEEWRLAELHRIATGRNVRVAVVDSMVDRTHPDLAGQVEVSENFVAGRPDGPELHGTGVAGIIAARSDNGMGIAGVAPRARLLALRACWQERGARDPRTVCDSLSLARALSFAIARRAQVINLSLSGPPDIVLGKLIDIALSRGVVVVGAFDRNLQQGGFPASHRGVIAVMDESAGSRVAGVLAAPGRDVPTTQPGGRWFLVSGSSYAAAHVSGLFALLKERAPESRGPSTPLIIRTGETIDACATLLQRPCDCCSRPHELLAAFPK